MSIIRKNTLVVDLSVLPARPEAGKVHQFLVNEIKLQLSDVKSIQLHNTRKCVFLEMVNNETALRYEKAHNIKRVFVWNNKEFKIHVYVDSEAVTVRVHDLPPSVPYKTVGDFMAKFGEVISIQSERWRQYFPGIPNGVRVLQMRLRGSIPSHINIENEVCFVKHKNQQRTCKWCSRAVHPKQKCLEVTAAENEKTATTSTTPQSPTETMFCDADFPPISSDGLVEIINSLDDPDTHNNEASTESTPIVLPTDAKQPTIRVDDDDDNGSDSSSPYELGDSTSKRRLPARPAQERE